MVGILAELARCIPNTAVRLHKLARIDGVVPRKVKYDQRRVSSREVRPRRTRSVPENPCCASHVPRYPYDKELSKFPKLNERRTTLMK